MVSYKDTKSLAQRIRESSQICQQYPGRIPIVVERSRSANNMPDIDKNKFLCPDNLTVGQFVYVIRKRITLPPEMAMFLFVDNTLPLSSSLIKEVYSKHKDIDGFLYMTYTGESTFGYDLTDLDRPSLEE
jgi:GABA(A) receptor-associated protein